MLEPGLEKESWRGKKEKYLLDGRKEVLQKCKIENLGGKRGERRRKKGALRTRTFTYPKTDLNRKRGLGSGGKSLRGKKR